MADVRNCEARATVAPLTSRAQNDAVWQKTSHKHPARFKAIFLKNAK
jgi:hypothetical protein